MPTYEYHCEKCGHQFETFQPISAPPLRNCPKEVCPGKKWGRGRVKKIIGAGAGLLFKGSGFYITDYRSPKYQEAAKKESAPPTKAEKSAPAAKTESKPAAGGSTTPPKSGRG
jgi:putative FmdB family regulatory protein